MEERIRKIDGICDKYGLAINQLLFKVSLDLLEDKKGEGFLEGRGVEEQDYIETIVEKRFVDKLFIPKDCAIYWSESLEKKQVPDWFKQSVVFEYTPTGELEAVYNECSYFNQTVWFRYLQREELENVFTEGDFKKCKLVEKFSKNKIEPFVKALVAEKTNQLIIELNQRYDYNAMLNEIREELRAEYRSKKRERWLSDLCDRLIMKIIKRKGKEANTKHPGKL